MKGHRAISGSGKFVKNMLKKFLIQGFFLETFNF